MSVRLTERVLAVPRIVALALALWCVGLQAGGATTPAQHLSNSSSPPPRRPSVQAGEARAEEVAGSANDDRANLARASARPVADRLAPRATLGERIFVGAGDERGSIGFAAKPVRRVYEPYGKHRAEPYVDRGRVVSRAPRGDCQAILDCSVARGPRNRVAVEAGTGLPVELRRHEIIELPEEILERWHGYVPGG